MNSNTNTDLVHHVVMEFDEYNEYNEYNEINNFLKSTDFSVFLDEMIRYYTRIIVHLEGTLVLEQSDITRFDINLKLIYYRHKILNCFIF